MKLFLFSNTIRTFLKNFFDEYQHRPEVQIHLDAKIKQRSEQKSRRKMKAKRSSRKREHLLNDKSEKRSVLGK
jgi:hypothetical protein